MVRRIISMALAAAVITAIGAPAAQAAEKATVKATAAWVGKGSMFQTSENTALFLGAFGGVLYVESQDGKLDAVKLVCPGTFDVELKSGAQEGSGNCIVTDKEGDQVFAEWSCTGQKSVACEGDFKLTSGTGKFQGITGKSELKARTSLSEIVVDLRSGSVAETGAGVLVLPKLTYKIP